MDKDPVCQESTSGDDVDSLVPEQGSNRGVDLEEEISSNGEIDGYKGRASESLRRVEMDLACSSEKLVNLSILVMHVATRESDFESFVWEKDNLLVDSAQTALEFDVLSGILDSEVRELDSFMLTLQNNIKNSRDMLSALDHSNETFLEMEENLHASEDLLSQSQDQVSELKLQSVKFQKILTCLDETGNWNGDQAVNLVEDCQFPKMNEDMKMQTAEQQRNILRMLERSLAREMDLEKKLTESRQIEKELRMRLLSSEQEVFCLEEEAEEVLEQYFESENSAEVLIGTSKELLGRLQNLQFSLNSSVLRETDIQAKLKDTTYQLEARESDLQKFGSSSGRLNDFLVAQTENLKASLKAAEDKIIMSNSEVLTLRERASSLEEQIKDYECEFFNVKASENEQEILYSQIRELGSVIEGFEDKVSLAESRAETAEEKCKLLSQTNMEFHEEFSHLKRSGVTLEKVESLEKQLRETNLQLQHAVASAEASQEDQKMLKTTIGDMENLINDLKSKIARAENQADNAEEKLIIVSESNAELNDELGFLRSRLACLEAALHQAEEVKLETAKDIGNRTKVMTNLVMQLAMERERLHHQISTLSMNNNIMVVKLKQTDKESSVIHCKEALYSKHGLNTSPRAKENKIEAINFSGSGHKMEKKDLAYERETEVTRTDSEYEHEIVRRVDVGVLNLKHTSFALFFILISMTVAYIFQSNKLLFP